MSNLSWNFISFSESRLNSVKCVDAWSSIIDHTRCSFLVHLKCRKSEFEELNISPNENVSFSPAETKRHLNFEQIMHLGVKLKVIECLFIRLTVVIHSKRFISQFSWLFIELIFYRIFTLNDQIRPTIVTITAIVAMLLSPLKCQYLGMHRISKINKLKCFQTLSDLKSWALGCFYKKYL